MRRALFVAKKAQGSGQFEERSSNVFKAGEPLVAYAEPVGYGWKDVGNGMFEFGFAVDFLIKSPDGKILAGQQDFAKLAERSRTRNLEFMGTLTLNGTGAPPGDYVVEYKLRDRPRQIDDLRAAVQNRQLSRGFGAQGAVPPFL